MPFDESVLMTLESLRTPALNCLFLFLTKFGEEMILMPLIAFLLWCGHKRNAIYIGTSYFVGLFVNNFLKITFCIPRPFLRFENLTAVTEALPSASGFSFPSGHTAGAAAVYGAIWTLSDKKWLKGLMALLIAAVALSRLYLGVHTPSDVLTAIAVGAALVALLRLAANSLAINPDLKKSFFIFGFAAIICGLFYVLVKPYPAGTEIKLKSDTMKTLGAALGALVGFLVESRWIRFNHPQSWIAKILVFITGIALTIGLRIFLKAPLNAALGEMSGGLIRYALISLWITAFYPAVFSRVLNPRGNRRPTAAQVP